jgi:hypothetical protein
MEYRRKQIAELRPYEPGAPLEGVSISAADKAAGSPKAGDMIARNPNNHEDQAMRKEEYLGDGLYVSFDGFAFTLRAPREYGDHYVVLEPFIIEEFNRFVRAILEPKP